MGKNRKWLVPRVSRVGEWLVIETQEGTVRLEVEWGLDIEVYWKMGLTLREGRHTDHKSKIHPDSRCYDVLEGFVIVGKGKGIEDTAPLILAPITETKDLQYKVPIADWEICRIQTRDLGKGGRTNDEEGKGSI